MDVNIEDCRRLGRYTQDKNRPHLVTFANVWDARKCRCKAIENGLYKNKGVFVVPALSYEDRQQEKKVLKKRSQLLQNNVDRSKVKFDTSSSFSKGMKFSVTDYNYHCLLSIPALFCLLSVIKRIQLAN